MNLRAILKYLIYAAALTPLIIFSQFVSPFHFGKVVVFRSLIEFMAVLYLLLAWREPAYRPRIDRFFWVFLAFALAFTVTTFTSVNVYQSFWGTLERMGGLWTFWHYFVFYIILTAILRTKEDWRTFLKISVVVGVLSALYGFGQRTDISFFVGSGGRDRIFGTIGNPALFAGYQIVNVFLALILGFGAVKNNERNFFFISAMVMSIAVFMTAVRGSLVGIVVGLVVFAFLYFAQTHSKISRQIFIWLMTLVIVVGGLAFLFRSSSLVQNSPYLSRVTDLSLSNNTVQTRIWAWQAGLKGWSEGPRTMIFGWGPENFNIPFSKYFNPQFFKGPGSETLFDRAHNMFVEILVTMGLLGEIAYIGLFVVIFRTLWRLKEKPESRIPAIGLISMTLAYMIHNAFIFDTSANFIIFFSALGFMSFLNAEPRTQKVTMRPVSPALWRAAGTVLFIACGVLVYQTNVLMTEANFANTRAIIAGWNNDFPGAVAKFQEAVGYGVAGKYEYRNQFSQYLINYGSDNQVTSDTATVLQDAIAEEEKNEAESPRDYLPDLYLSRLNILLGKNDPHSPYNDEALKYSQKALSYSPTFVRTYYEVAQAYVNKQDSAKAEETFQKAIDLNPTVGLSYWYLAAVQMQSGDLEQGLKTIDQAISHGYGLGENDYLNLAGIYIKRSDFQHLADIYEKLIKIVPDNPQYHASLAVAYSRIGRVDDAIAQARVAAQFNPDFEPEAQKFVESLGRQW